MQNLQREFREFAMRGNVVDLAVGVIIGGAFGKIVDSLVKDMVMPVVGHLLGGVDFRHLSLNLSGTAYATLADAEKAGAPLIKYDYFINTVVDFLIIAFVIFLAIKAMNSLRRHEAAAPPSRPAAGGNRAAARYPRCVAAQRLRLTSRRSGGHRRDRRPIRTGVRNPA